MSNYWNSSYAVGWSKFNSNQQGIPFSKPKWIRCFSETGAGLDPIISYDDVLYFLSGGNQQHPVVAINLNDGEIIWTFDQPPVNDIFSGMCANSDFLVVSDKLFSVKGEKIVNFTELLDSENFQTDTPYLLGDNYILRIINHDLDPYRYLIYDLSNNTHQIKHLPVIYGEMCVGSDLVFGFTEKNSNDFLACCSINGDILWEIEAPLGVLTLHDKIVNYTSKNISVFSKEKGKLVNRLKSMENKFSEDEIDTFYKSHSFETINILSKGRLHIFSISEDRLLKTIEGYDIHDFCVSGDLIFTRQGKWDLAAYDRFSGDEVWRISERYAWQSMIASNNKLVVYCATGDIVCFDCSEPYTSPFRSN